MTLPAPASLRARSRLRPGLLPLLLPLIAPMHRPPVPDPVVDSLRALVDPSLLPPDLAAAHIRAGALFARLKALNRAANGATRAQKQATANARLQMDHTYLGLQNLLYEKRHLEREIEKCRQFASVYQDVPVHSLDEFVQLAPEEAKSDLVLSNEHQLMLNRLSFELAERQRLDQKHKELTRQKEELLKESKAKLATMDNVKAQIDSLIKTATEVQKKVGDLAGPLDTPDANTAAS